MQNGLKRVSIHKFFLLISESDAFMAYIKVMSGHELMPLKSNFEF